MLWYLLLAAAQVAGFILIPLGLPGLWLMVGAGLAYRLLAGTGGPSWLVLGLATGLGIVAEVLEFTLSAKYTRKYGGSSRAGWGALLGGFVGAFMGVPIPIVGSVIGAFAGSFLGALVAEYSLTRNHAVAGRSAWGALIGRVAATAVKTGLGAAIAVLVLTSGWPR
ncbi:MAG: DUF456 family protein [Gemmatimonadales bacterium]